MTEKIFKENTLLEIKNNISDKIIFMVTTGPLTGQVIEYSNIRYDKINDILYFNYSFENPIEVDENFKINEHLYELLKIHLAFKDKGTLE
jgi:hypothetical protein